MRMVDASKVDFLMCQFDCGGAFEGTFKVQPKTECCAVKLDSEFLDGIRQRTTVRIVLDQLHVLSNSATTGHKLQGRSLDSIFVSDWNLRSNWPYVVLSRVRTLKGLYLREPLDPTADYTLDDRLVKMLEEFKQHQPRDYNREEFY